MTHKATLRFKELQTLYPNRIMFLSYADGQKELVFAPLAEPKKGLMCSCGNDEYNATNFGGDVHFCPNRQLTVEVSEFCITPAKK